MQDLGCVVLGVPSPNLADPQQGFYGVSMRGGGRRREVYIEMYGVRICTPGDVYMSYSLNYLKGVV